MTLFSFEPITSRIGEGLEAIDDLIQTIRNAQNSAAQENAETSLPSPAAEDVEVRNSSKVQNQQRNLNLTLTSGIGNDAVALPINVNSVYTENTFSITYYSKTDGKPLHFVFALMPAIESNTRPVVQGQTVPGVAPGIVINTKMRHRAMLIPGGTPVYQSIGLESIDIRLCGLFSGDELQLGSSSSKTFFRDEPTQAGSNGYNMAQYFRQNVVIPGVPVDLNISASSGFVSQDAVSPTFNSDAGRVQIKGKLLITDFRSISARATRDYYCIEGYLINYELEKRADPEGTGAAADIKACELEAENYRKNKAEVITVTPTITNNNVYVNNNTLDVMARVSSLPDGVPTQLVLTNRYIYFQSQLFVGILQNGDFYWVSGDLLPESIRGVYTSTPPVGSGYPISMLPYDLPGKEVITYKNMGSIITGEFNLQCLRILRNAGLDTKGLNQQEVSTTTEQPNNPPPDGSGAATTDKLSSDPLRPSDSSLKGTPAPIPRAVP